MLQPRLLRAGRREFTCSLRGDGPETIELALHEAAAGVCRRVDQAVRGHHAVLADAADPVVARVIVGHQIDQLDAPVIAEDVSAGCLLAVASMVMPGRAQVPECGVGSLDLARARVAAFGEIGAEPDQSADHEYVDGGSEAGRRGALPEGLARVCRKRRQTPAVGVEHEIVVNDQRGDRPADGSLEEGPLSGCLAVSRRWVAPSIGLGGCRRGPPPEFFAALGVEAEHAPRRREVHTPIGCGQR